MYIEKTVLEVDWFYFKKHC